MQDITLDTTLRALFEEVGETYECEDGMLYSRLNPKLNWMRVYKSGKVKIIKDDEIPREMIQEFQRMEQLWEDFGRMDNDYN